MLRSSLHVRPATREDLPALLELGEELREQLLPLEGTLRSRTSAKVGRAGLEQRYTEAVDDPDRHLVLVTGAGEEVLGMALLTVASANALLDLPAVHMSHAVVPDRYDSAGRRLVHHEGFLKKEQRFRHYRRSIDWEQDNLGRFLR